MKKILMAVLVFLGFAAVGSSIKINAAVFADTITKGGVTYNLVKSQAEFTDGDYIIAAETKESSVAYAGDNPKEFINAVADLESATIWAVTVSESASNFQNKGNSKYLALTSDGNKAYEVDALADTANWDVTIADGSSANIKSLKYSTRVLKYNPTNPRFACYKSGQTPVVLYKAASDTPVTEYNVLFNTNGGTAVASIKVAVDASDKKIAAPTAPTKAFSEFVGWYKDAELTDDWDFATDEVTKNITLYAKWNSVYTLVAAGTNVTSGYYAIATTTDGTAFMTKELNAENFFPSSTDVAGNYDVKVQKVVGKDYYVLSVADKFIGATNATAGTFVLADEPTGELFYWTITAEATKTKIENVGKTSNKLISYYANKTAFNLFSSGAAALFKSSNTTAVEDYVAAPSQLAEFIKTETKTSLKVTYDADLVATDVDIRFGGVVNADAYLADAKYGVIITSSNSVVFNAGKTSYASAAEYVESLSDSAFVECTPALLENGSYQFAWVVNNMEGHYADLLTAVMYMEYDGVLYLCDSTVDSVVSAAEQYTTNTELTEEQKAVMQLIVDTYKIQP